MKIQILANRRKPRFGSALQFMPAVMCGNAAGDVSFMETAVLRRTDWSGKTVGPQARSRIAHHSAELTEHMRGKNMGVRNLPERFPPVPVLTLAGRLLQDFVRHHQPRAAFIGVNTGVVRRRPLAIEHSGKAAAAA